MAVRPPPDRISAMVCKFDRRSRRLADHGAEVVCREEAVDSNGDGLFNLGRLLGQVHVLCRRLLRPKQQLGDLLEDGRVLFELVGVAERGKEKIWRGRFGRGRCFGGSRFCWRVGLRGARADGRRIVNFHRLRATPFVALVALRRRLPRRSGSGSGSGRRDGTGFCWLSLLSRLWRRLLCRRPVEIDRIRSPGVIFGCLSNDCELALFALLYRLLAGRP